MQEVDINTLLQGKNILNINIPDNIIIVGKIDQININNIYDKLDLFKVDCNKIHYYNQKGKNIKNHILPNSLIELYCHNNELTSLPDLPKSLEVLSCFNNELTSLPDLPKSLEVLSCFNNELTSLPEFKNKIKILYCSFNKLTSLPNLPSSLQKLHCGDNQLTSLPEFKNKITILFNQDKPIKYIPYTNNIELYTFLKNKIIIEDYPDNPITSQDGLNKYMKYIKNYQRNRIKSARK